MIATVTNQDCARWQIIDGNFDSGRLIEFLELLIKDTGKKVILILDNLRVHHSKPVKAWLEENKEKIECFYLPSYSPELNPEERLNSDLKQAIGSKVQVRYSGEIACRCQRSHDDAGEQPKTRRFLLSSPTRKICRLKLFNGRVDSKISSINF